MAVWVYVIRFSFFILKLKNEWLFLGTRINLTLNNLTLVKQLYFNNN